MLDLGPRIARATPGTVQAIRDDLAALKSDLSALGGVSRITTPFSKIDRALGADTPDAFAAYQEYQGMRQAFLAERAWREAGEATLRADLETFLAEVQQGVAIRTLDAIPSDYRRSLAWCLSGHRDISLRF